MFASPDPSPVPEDVLTGQIHALSTRLPGSPAFASQEGLFQQLSNAVSGMQFRPGAAPEGGGNRLAFSSRRLHRPLRAVAPLAEESEIPG